MRHPQRQQNARRRDQVFQQGNQCCHPENGPFLTVQAALSPVDDLHMDPVPVQDQHQQLVKGIFYQQVRQQCIGSQQPDAVQHCLFRLRRAVIYGCLMFGEGSFPGIFGEPICIGILFAASPFSEGFLIPLRLIGAGELLHHVDHSLLLHGIPPSM